MKEKVNELNATQKQLRIMSTFFIVAAIICMILIFRNLPFATGMFVVLMVFYFGYFKRQIKKYNLRIKAAVMEHGLGTFFKKASYEPKDGIAIEDIQKADFLPSEHPDRIVIRDTVRGFYKSMPAFITDITTDYEAEIITHKGKKRRSSDFLAGCLYDVQLRKDQGEGFILWPKSCMTEEARDTYFKGKYLFEIPEDTAWPGLCNYYVLYGKVPDEAPQVPEDFILAFKELAQFSPGQVAAQVRKDHLRVFVRDRFLYTVTLPIKMEITEEILALNPFAEMEYILKLSDTLIRK